MSFCIILLSCSPIGSAYAFQQNGDVKAAQNRDEELQDQLLRQKDAAAHGQDISYSMVAVGAGERGTAPRTWRKLIFRSGTVTFTAEDHGAADLGVSCESFQYKLLTTNVFRGTTQPILSVEQGTTNWTIEIKTPSANVVYGALFDQIRNACSYFTEEKRKTKLRESILSALHASDEPEPFASIRGEFDLTANDSRHWKTNLQLTGADDCVLYKNPPPAGPDSSAWTFGCVFKVDRGGIRKW
jgi:hypothetical protein